MKKLWLPAFLLAVMLISAACTSETVAPETVEVVKEVVVEREVPKVIEKQVVVEVEKEVVVEREVPVVEKVEVEKQVVVEKEVKVVQTVVVEKIVEKIVEKEAKRDPKILRISTNFVPGDFNTMTGGTPKEFIWAVTSVLVKADPTSAEGYRGDLAESWEVNEAGDSYTFYLRKNAVWHDGVPVTAADVEWTYTMLLNNATGSRSMGKLAMIKGAAAYTAGEADSVEGIVVIDDHTIRFDQEYANSLFIQEAGTTFERAILPKHAFEGVAPGDLRQERFFFDSPIGSGPFKFEKYVEGQYFRMVANEDYYLGRPVLDEVIVSIILSSEAAQIAFQRGEIHAMSFDGGTDATTEMFQDAIDDPGTNVAAEDGSTLISYAFNSRSPHLVDPRIRQAFLHALDRQKLIDTFVGGNGKIFNSFMTHGWYQKAEWRDRYPYDPEKAKALLAEAGWDSDTEVTCTIIAVGSEEARAMLAAEQAMLAEVGFKLVFKEVALMVWVDTFYETYDWETIRVTFGVFGDPDGFLKFHVRTGSRNAMGYANAETDAKMDAAGKTIARADRIPLYQEINEEMLTNLPLAPVYLKDWWTIVSKRWYVPGIGDMRPATSLSDMPTFPIVAKHGEVYNLSPHLWDLRDAN